MLFRQIFFCRILSVSCTTDNVCFGRPNLHFKEVHYYEHRQIKNTQNDHARHDGCHRRCHLTYSENRGYVPYCTPDKNAPNTAPVSASGGIPINIIRMIPMRVAQSNEYHGPRSTEQTMFIRCAVGHIPSILRILFVMCDLN